jgi:hypothetical protein
MGSILSRMLRRGRARYSGSFAYGSTSRMVMSIGKQAPKTKRARSGSVTSDNEQRG